MESWNNEPYVTGHELAEMEPYERYWFENQPNIWLYSKERDVLYNVAHPDNLNSFVYDLLCEVENSFE